VVNKSLAMGEIRELTSRELCERARSLKEQVAKIQYINQTSPGRPAVSTKDLKRDVARVLTVIRQRQLNLDAMQKAEESRRKPVPVCKAPGALLRATLVTDKLPLRVGQVYRLILRRSSEAQQLALNYASIPASAKSIKQRKKHSQDDYVIRFFSKRLTVQPDLGKRRHTEQEYTLGKTAELSLRLEPKLAGDCDLDVFVYSKNHLLQLLQLSFPAWKEAA
jgi:large subunit ribosomal protein L29